MKPGEAWLRANTDAWYGSPDEARYFPKGLGERLFGHPPDRYRQTSRVSGILDIIRVDMQDPRYALDQAEFGRLIQGLLRLAEGAK